MYTPTPLPRQANLKNPTARLKKKGKKEERKKERKTFQQFSSRQEENEKTTQQKIKHISSQIENEAVQNIFSCCHSSLQCFTGTG